MKNYSELREIDVTNHIEKKPANKQRTKFFSYLSWAWAVDTMLQLDPDAYWNYGGFDGQPYCKIGDTAMVFCTVTLFGKNRTAQLPVMDAWHQAIPNPNSVDINIAMQRALAKAIALHGIGLHIYAGEDLPPGNDGEAKIDLEETAEAYAVSMDRATSVAQLRDITAGASRFFREHGRDDLRLSVVQYATDKANKINSGVEK
jgi:hypothetical protein